VQLCYRRPADPGITNTKTDLCRGICVVLMKIGCVVVLQHNYVHLLSKCFIHSFSPRSLRGLDL
jgi:hypothetical protein